MPNTPGTLIANLLAKPNRMNPTAESHGRVRTFSATIPVANGDTAGHIYPIKAFVAEDRLLDWFLSTPAIAGGPTLDVAFYNEPNLGRWNVADGIREGTNQYADAASLTAALQWGQLDGLSAPTGLTAAVVGRPLWALAGLAARPEAGKQFSMAVLIDAGTFAAAGSFQIIGHYTKGD